MWGSGLRKQRVRKQKTKSEKLIEETGCPDKDKADKSIQYIYVMHLTMNRHAKAKTHIRLDQWETGCATGS